MIRDKDSRRKIAPLLSAGKRQLEPLAGNIAALLAT